MADNVFDRLAEYAQSIQPAKRQDVANATQSKKAARGFDPLAATAASAAGVGMASASQEEQDFRTMGGLEYLEKYGLDAFMKRGDAVGQYISQSTGERTRPELITDTAIDVGTGVLNTFGGIGALGAGLINDDLGVAAASALNSANKGLMGLQSNTLNAARNIVGMQKAAAERDSILQEEQDIASGTSPVVAKLSRIGRDTLNSVGLELGNSSTLSSGIAQGLGSLYGGAGLIKGVSTATKVAGAVLPVATKAAQLMAGTASKTPGSVGFNLLDDAAPAVLGVVAMESGGAYQQAAGEIASRSFKQLAQTSPEFNQLVASGMSPEDARIQLADAVGKRAAAYVAPAAAIAGRAVGAFEASPFTPTGVGSVAKNLIGQFIEEGTQGGVSQAAQNVAANQILGTKDDWAAGVGEQIGTGALYGLGSAGVAQIPGGAISAGARAVGKVTDWSKQRLQRIQEKNDAASPIAANVVEAANNEVVAKSAETEAVIEATVDTLTTVDDVQKDSIKQYVKDVINVAKFDPAELNPEYVPADLLEAVSESTTRAGALSKIIEYVDSAPENSQQQIVGSMVLLDVVNKAAPVIQNEPAGFDELKGVEEARQLVEELGAVLMAIEQTPNVARAFGKAIQAIAAVNVQPVTEESLATPEGVQNVNVAIAQASIAPEKANEEVIGQILKHASNGKLNLSEKQISALLAASALIKGAKAYDAEAARLGLTPKDIVSTQIKTDDKRMEQGELSTLSHAKGIRAAYEAGDLDLARDRLVHLMEFAQHMQNKVAALNTHLATGNNDPKLAVRYQALLSDRTWRESKNGLGVNVNSKKSIEFAQQVALEAGFIGEVANNLATAYPELGVNHVQLVPLDERLQDSAEEVMAAATTAKPVSSETVQVEQPKTADVKETLATEVTTPAPVPEATVTETVAAAEIIDQAAEKKVRKSKKKAKEIEEQQLTLDLTTDEKTEVPAEPVTKEEVVAEAVSESVVEELVQPEPEAPAEEAAQLEPEAQAEEAVAVEAPAEVTEDFVVDEEPEKKTGIASVFPNLISGENIKNYFWAAFKLPAEVKTRIFGDETPMRSLYEIFRNPVKYSDFIGKDSDRLSLEAAQEYRKLFEVSGELITIMKKQLKAFSSKVDFDKEAAKGNAPNTWVRGKILNIVERRGDELGYNPALIQSAVLAAMQWYLTARNFMGEKTTEDIARIAEVEGEDLFVDEELVNLFNSGFLAQEAVYSLAQKIESYWGLSRNKDVAKGYVEGIPLAVAAELIDAMVELGMLSKTEFALNHTGGIAKEGEKVLKTPIIYSIEPIPEDNPIHEFPNAIEEAVMLEPERVFYFGGNKPTVSPTQLNSSVPNTREQMKAIENEINTEYFIHEPMYALFTAMGKENILDLMGLSGFDPKKMNKNHAETIKGRVLSIVSAFETMDQLIREASNEAEDFTTVPIHYGFNMTSVARLQMLGNQNPQASKLMREVVLPTYSILDLSNEQTRDFGNFMVGIAQAVGIKVHNQLREATIAEVQEKLNGKFADAVAMLQEWHSLRGDFDEGGIAVLKDALGSDMSFVAVSALAEYARFLNAEDKANFRTPVYVEADGVTNGPGNSIVLLTPGQFSEDQLKNMAKVGLFIGTNRTMNEHRSSIDGKDLYQSTTDFFSKNLTRVREFFRNYKEKPQIYEQHRHVEKLLGLFIKDIGVDGDGNITFKRGIAKNPLTVTTYGSGIKGISSKIVKSLMDEIYERLTLAAQNPDTPIGVAMFGRESASVEEAQQKYDTFVRSFTALTQKFTVYSRKKNEFFLIETNAAVRKGIDPVKFTLTKEEFVGLSGNFVEHFVGPLVTGINEVMGSSLRLSLDTLQTMTQAQSLMMKFSYEAEVAKALEEVDKRSDFLSDKQLKQIEKDLLNEFPLVTNGKQNFYIAGRTRTDVSSSNIARSLNESVRADAIVYAPDDAGVGGIPKVVIGYGDGYMMQNMSVAKDAPSDTLKIFDGVHLRLDMVQEGSVKANEAVFNSWMQNPMKDVTSAFIKSIESFNWGSLNDKQKKVLQDSLIGKDDAVSLTTEELRQAAEAVAMKGKKLATTIEARHRALNMVNLSVDQMAAIGSPYTREGKIDLSSMSDEEKVKKLNELYVSVRDTISEFLPPEPMEPLFETSGVEDPSGVRILNRNDLNQVIANGKLPHNQMMAYSQIMNSAATENLKVVVGDADSIRQFILDNGYSNITEDEFNNVKEGKTKGWFSVNDGIVYVADPSVETVLHEAIHYATFNAIMDYYYGDTSVDSVVADSLARTEALMNQFMGMDDSVLPENLKNAVSDLRSTINGYLSDFTNDEAFNKAAALNEFMAWGLSNRHLANKLKATKANKFGAIVERLVKYVQNIIKPLLRIPSNSWDNSMFDSLLFNTIVVSNSKSTLRGMNVNLKHATQSNDRLKSVADTFDRLITSYLGADVVKRTARKSQSVGAELAAISLANEVQANGFKMNTQEVTAFHKIVTAMMSDAQLDPNALVRAGELYRHVIDNVKIEDFLSDPNTTDPTEWSLAQYRYNTIVGDTITKVGSNKLSSVLPVFVALATVNEQFRGILRNIPVPQQDKVLGNTLDDLLTNVGISSMERLSEKLTNPTGSKTVGGVMDSLMAVIQMADRKEDTLFDRLAKPAGSMLDRANEMLVGKMTALSNAAIELGEATKNDPNKSKYQKGLAQAAMFLGGMINEKSGAAVAEGFLEQLEKSRGAEPFFDLVNDLVGRTGQNQDIYDMIKQVRTHVQQDRQHYREYLPQVIAEQFSRKLTDKEWESLHLSMGKTDLAALVDSMPVGEALELAASSIKRATKIRELETAVAKMEGAKSIKDRAKNLAKYMVTGEVSTNMGRNAYAIANLFGEARPTNYKATSDQVALVDQLVTLYALELLNNEDMATLSSLVQSEGKGMEFTLSYLVGQRKGDLVKMKNSGKAMANHYKGSIPTDYEQGVTLVVRDDAEYSDLISRSYVRVGDYVGSSADESKASRGYYFLPVAARNPFSQGIIQNVLDTAGGVHLGTGLSVTNTAGVIANPVLVKRAMQKLAKGETGKEKLMPIFDSKGNVIAYERSLSTEQLARKQADNHLARAIGVWRGRQVEEYKAGFFNQKLIDAAFTMYDRDVKLGKKDLYVNVLDSDDPIIRDAVSLFSSETIAHAEALFGEGEFWIRRSSLNDILGYREASVGDAWTGQSKLSEKTRTNIRQAFTLLFGNDAYKYVMNAENVLQNVVSEAKVLIVVKSVIVPALNAMANIYQLIARGVPVKDILSGIPRKTHEINRYVNDQMELVQLEAELRANEGNPAAARSLKNRIANIKESHKRLSIWPLIERGEFSSIADAGISRDDIHLANGKLAQYMETLVERLPAGIRTAGRYAIVSKDTALFQGIQKAVNYSDFVAKAIMYDDLTKRQEGTEAEALGQITEEFVNYDRLPGRFRGYMESVGLLWFYNFKIRSAKVAMSMMRNNPVHALFAMSLPAPTFIGNVGLPIEDNFFSVLASGNIDNSIGLDQLLRAPELNPWHNLVN